MSLISRKDGVIGWMVFNNPERRNALSVDMWQAIPRVIAEFEGHVLRAQKRFVLFDQVDFGLAQNADEVVACQGLELDVIAAVFIGGASALGGVGQVAGAVIGAFIMGVMNNGMSIMGVNIDWQQMIKGVVLLAAVFFDLYNKNRSA